MEPIIQGVCEVIDLREIVITQVILAPARVEVSFETTVPTTVSWCKFQCPDVNSQILMQTPRDPNLNSTPMKSSRLLKWGPNKKGDVAFYKQNKNMQATRNIYMSHEK